MLVGILLWLGAKGTLSDIRKDLKENTYLTYEGQYTFARHDSTSLKYGRIDDPWFDVCLEDSERAIWVQLYEDESDVEPGSFEGTIVYAKNSLVVVDIQ